jgi:hypothetical protein
MLSTKKNDDAQVQVQGLVYDCYFYRNTEALQGIGRLFESFHVKHMYKIKSSFYMRGDCCVCARPLAWGLLCGCVGERVCERARACCVRLCGVCAWQQGWDNAGMISHICMSFCLSLCLCLCVCLCVRHRRGEQH